MTPPPPLSLLRAFLSSVLKQPGSSGPDGVPCCCCFSSELGSAGWGRGLPAAPDTQPHPIWPLHDRVPALLLGQTRLVLAGGSGLSDTAAAAHPTTGQNRIQNRQDAAGLHLHAALLPQVRGSVTVLQ